MQVDAQRGHGDAAPATGADGELELSAIGRVLWRKRLWVLVPSRKRES
jgi:hypothetical protein